MSWLTDNAVFTKLPPVKLLALVAYGEARGEGAEGMMAVLNVVNNRTADRIFYDSEIYNATKSAYHAVILKEKQFSVFNFGDSNRPILVSLAEKFDQALLSNFVLRQAYQLAQMLLNQILTDNTGGSVYYHASNIIPYWASSFIKVGQIGSHLFYATSTSLARAREAAASVTATLTSAISQVPVTNWVMVFILGLGGIWLMDELSKGRKVA